MKAAEWVEKERTRCAERCERERCANLVDRLAFVYANIITDPENYIPAKFTALTQAAQAIRERG